MKARTRERSTLASALVLIVALAAPGASHAVLIDLGTVTRDPSTSLNWLDLKESVDRSFNDVTAQLGPGGDFAGYRHAARAEIEALWTNALIPDLNSGYTAANFVPVGDLIELLGATFTDADGSRGAFGFSADILAGTLFDHHLPFLRECVSRTNCPPEEFERAIADSSDLLSDGLFALDFTFPEIGHWLVQSVPEPETLLLVLLGVTGVGVARRRIPRRVGPGIQASR